MGVKYNIDVVVTDAGNVYMNKSEVSKKEAENGPSWNHIGEISPKEGRKRFSEVFAALQNDLPRLGYLLFGGVEEER